jgi:hypothetical protein
MGTETIATVVDTSPQKEVSFSRPTSVRSHYGGCGVIDTEKFNDVIAGHGRYYCEIRPAWGDSGYCRCGFVVVGTATGTYAVRSDIDAKTGILEDNVAGNEIVVSTSVEKHYSITTVKCYGIGLTGTGAADQVVDHTIAKLNSRL